MPSGSAPSASTTPLSPSPAATPDTWFAVIGDFGSGDGNEAAVANMVKSWKPEFIVGLGDIYYSEAGGSGASRYDRAVGNFYCAWLKDVRAKGGTCPSGTASKNAFFPTLGNHDLEDATPAPATYLDYFKLPGAGFANSSGNERYYDFVQGPVHFFVLNSNPDEQDGTTKDSVQAAWLKRTLAASKARWKIVVDHHPPYSSDNSHGSAAFMQWPFAQWGANAVLSGHAHVYERVERDGIVYFVNGLGGAERYAFGGTPVAGSKIRFADNWGAQLVRANQNELQFDFYDVSGKRIDTYTLRKA